MNHPICPNCQSPIPPDAPGGLCPSCVLLAAASTGSLPPGIAAAPDLETVRAAFPELEIIELIGHGGMGVVFKGRQPRLDRLVALKILPPVLATQPGFAERFTREARALGRLSHPNIVAVYDFGQRAGIFYLMMEFVSGVNLRQAMRAGVKPEQALILVPRICEALQFAHDHGVLHRDIKPENILLDTTGTPKLADFGIAKFAGDAKTQTGLTQTGAALGTAAYMAPEQIEKPATVDHRADIYSLGVVLYEMLTGELPLGRFAAPSEKAHVTRGVDDVVLRALEKERERRQQSANEMKTEVEHARTNPGTGAHAVAAPPGRGGGAGSSGAWNPGQAPHSGPPGMAGNNGGAGDFGWYLGRFFIALTALSGAMIPLAGGSRTVGNIVSPATLALLCPVFGAMIGVSYLLFGSRRPGSLPATAGAAPSGTPFWKKIFVGVMVSALIAFACFFAAFLFYQSARHRPSAAHEKPPISVVLPAGGNSTAKIAGGTIELVALANSPSKGEPWWNMDGSRAGNTFVVDRRDLKVHADQRAYDFIFRRAGFPEGTSFEGYRVRDSSEESSGSLVELATRPGQKLPGYEALSAVLPSAARTANLRVAIAFSEWTAINQSAANNSITDSGDYGGVHWSFSHGTAYETNTGETVITYQYLTPPDWEIRVTGITASGQEVRRLRLSRLGAQAEWIFPTPKAEKIIQFRLQVRPIEYVEFRDIVLPPRGADFQPPDSTASASASDTASVKTLPSDRTSEPPSAPSSASPSPTRPNNETTQRLGALYDENIRLAKTNLEEAQARYKAGVASKEELDIAEQELAVAEARGDVLRANQARLTLVEKQILRTTAQVQVGAASTEELHALQVKKTALQIEMAKAGRASPTASTAADLAKLDAIYDEAVQLARQNLEMTRKRFEAGISSSLDVTKAERDVAVAEARGDTLRTAKARLAYAEQALALIQERVKSGLASTEELHAVQNDKIEAEIEIAKSKEQK